MAELVRGASGSEAPTPDPRQHSSAGWCPATWYQALPQSSGLLVWYTPTTLQQLDSGIRGAGG